MNVKAKKKSARKEVDHLKEYRGKYVLCWMPCDYDRLEMPQRVGIVIQAGKAIVSNGFPEEAICYSCIENALGEHFPL